MDNAGRAAGRARTEIVLLDDEGAAARAGALAGNSDAVDTTADDDHVEMLAVQWRGAPEWAYAFHLSGLDAALPGLLCAGRLLRTGYASSTIAFHRVGFSTLLG